ncbi:hypothetical protein Dimus_039451 [Dionaea muscipula]
MLGRRSLKPELVELNQNLGRRRVVKGKITTMAEENAVNAAAAAAAAAAAGEALPALQARFVPNAFEVPSCIELPAINAPQYEIKPGTIQSLPTFNGLSQEDPYAHLAEFAGICSTLRINNFPMNALKLLLFPFSLRGHAKHWLTTLPPRSIRTWEEMSAAFLKKYFSVGKTLTYRRDITTFRQNDHEPLFEAWERFGDLIRKCPHHDIAKWQLVQSFYYGLLPQHRQMVDASCGGSVLTKNEDDVWQLFETMSEASQYQASFERREKVGTSVARGIHEVQVPIDNPTLRDISEKLELLLKKEATTAPAAPQAAPTVYQPEPCVTCGSPSHHYSVCPATQPPTDPALEQANATQGYNTARNYNPRPKYDPYAATYNPGWRDHPNFSWKAQPQAPAAPAAPVAPPPPPAAPAAPASNTAFENSVLKALSEMSHSLGELKETQQQVRTNTQSIARLETQVGQIANALNRREEGRLPSQPVQPRGQHAVEGIPPGEIQAIMTLRNRKEVDTLPLLNKGVQCNDEEDDQEIPSQKEAELESNPPTPENNRRSTENLKEPDVEAYVPKVPFPSCARATTGEA